MAKKGSGKVVDSAVKSAWQNRIVGFAEKPAKEFNLNPLNWRTHGELQRTALNDVLSTIGWVTGVIENVVTKNLIDGHARVEEALKKGPNTPVPFLQVKLSEAEEKQILALLDPIGAMAGTDAEKIAELTEALELESDVLNDIISQMQPTSVDLDSFFEERKSESIVTEKYTIALEFDSKADYEKALTGLASFDPSPAAAILKLLKQAV